MLKVPSNIAVYGSKKFAVSSPNLSRDNTLSDEGPVKEEPFRLNDIWGRENEEFHKLFLNVDEADLLVEHYACAISKDGRMWVSEQCICFRGWKDEPVAIPFHNIKSIDKKNIAMIIPNSIEYFFASLMKRDETFELLNILWTRHVAPSSLFRTIPIINNCICSQLGTCDDCFAGKGRTSSLSRKKSSSRPRAHQRLNRLGLIDSIPQAPSARPRPSAEVTRLEASKKRAGSCAESLTTFSDPLPKMEEEVSPTGSIPFIKLNDAQMKSGSETKFKSLDRTRSLGRSESKKRLFESPVISQDLFYEDKAERRVKSEGGNTRSQSTPVSAQVPHISPEPKYSTLPRTSSEMKRNGETPLLSSSTDLPHVLETCKSCQDTTGTTVVLDHTFAYPIDAMFSLLFGFGPQQDGIPFQDSFMGKILLGPVRRCSDISLTNWSVPDSDPPPTLHHSTHSFPPVSTINQIESGLTRKFEYTIQISNPLSPYTKCYQSDEIRSVTTDFCCVKTTTKTPNVPSGTGFHTNVYTCLSRVEGGETRVLVRYEIVFTKSSWIRVAIERAAGDAIKASYIELKGLLATYLADISNGVFIEEVKKPSEVEKKRKRVKRAVKTKVVERYVVGGLVIDFTSPIVIVVGVNLVLLLVVNFMLLGRVGVIVGRHEERVGVILAHLVESSV